MSNTGLESYRQQLTAAVEEAKVASGLTSLAIEFDNRSNIDMRQQQEPFLCVEIMFTGGVQADLSHNPVHKITGILVLTAKSREGSGSAGCYKLLDELYPRLQRRVIGNVRLEMADFAKPRLVGGWWGVSALLPFRVNKFSA